MSSPPSGRSPVAPDGGGPPHGGASGARGSEAARAAMVRRQIADRGVTDARVLDAMRGVPREAFVAPDLAPEAYEDRPLPIACGQTISQPYVVAFMAQALGLSPSDRVLEVGAGSGYAAAVMSHLAREVVAVERHADLVDAARASLGRLGIENVRVVLGDGSLGRPADAPFDAISVACAAEEVPAALVAQLAPGGRLVMPVGRAHGGQDLVRIRRTPDGAVRRESLGSVRFVPLVGGATPRG